MLFELIQLESDEKMLRIVRKHWWIIFSRMLYVLLLGLLPLLLLFAALQYVPGDFIENIVSANAREIIFFYLAWLLMLWMMVANFWTDHYLDLWAITNRRIVAIDQRGFFHRFLSSFRLERLQDMNIQVEGVLPTLLNFGTIEAQTAGGSNEEFKTDYMPNPRELKALIINAADKRQQFNTNQLLNNDGTL